MVIDGAGSPLVMPRAELPAIIPLRQFGKDTWLAPGFIEAGRRRARVIRAQRRNRDGARRSLRAGGRKACRRLSRHGECGAQLRAPAQRAADDGAAVCFHSSGGISRPRRQAGGSSRRDIAPTWSRSTAPRSRFSTPGSPAPAASVRVSFPRSTRYSRPFVPAKAGTSRFIALSRSPSGFSLARE